MRITQIQLNGFRNFKNAIINVSPKTLVIGANDVGKSNMLYAIRMLLDRGLSDWDIEPKDSDFYCHEPTTEITITIKLEDITEDCVLSKLDGKISDEGTLYLQYRATKGSKEYKILAGPAHSHLTELEGGRYYRKVLHVKYISSNRDLHGYIKKEKRNLLKEAQEKRTDQEVSDDEIKLKSIEGHLTGANAAITELSYVSKATQVINTELQELSFHHTGQEVIFDVGNSDIHSFVENLHLSSKVNSSNLSIGGDGRNNQIFLALWAARNEIQEENPLEVTFYCIEEPEAHLHPHQQRKLASYLINTLKGQTFITSHSPQIASEFSPNSIVRLSITEKQTTAASNGCSQIIADRFYEFGYRLNIIAAEALFSNAVFLVEGPSEVLFFKVLAREIGIDLDKLNISILMADGIGFETFVKILHALNIKWVMRTDNDIMKIPKKDEFRFAGVQRAIKAYKNLPADSGIEALISTNFAALSGFSPALPPAFNTEIASNFITKLKTKNIFLSKIDLEQDLLESEISQSILEFLDVTDKQEALTIMQKRKATSMYRFLSSKSDSLKQLKNTEFAEPLYACKSLIENA
ncbi:ATP-dependent nuclease [Chitinophaga caseinilytica]|uniref:ATP-dependent nuclease n=1 Tax=Chitinophaga caseinilytica TaxID=2267521 RepID=UPI003C2F7542